MPSCIKWFGLALVCSLVAAVVFVVHCGTDTGRHAFAAPSSDDPFNGGPSAKPEAGEDTASPEKPPAREWIDVKETRRNGGEAAIKKALAEPTRINCRELPLDELIGRLRDMHKIEIQIDRKGLDEVAISADIPITKNLQGISLRSAIRLILHDLGLTYIIHEEVLLITTPENADARLLTEVYDVTDLVSVRDENGKFWHDHDSLIRTIIATIQPRYWDSTGSINGITFGNTATLVVSHNEAAHDEIVALLARIRQVVKEHGKKGEVPTRNPMPPPKKEIPAAPLKGAGAPFF